jgi:hypothetical protein
MATAKPTNSLPFRRRWKRIAALALLAALIALAWAWTSLGTRAQAAASYGARIACACRFVAGREIGTCSRDFEPGMGFVFVSEDAEDKSVTARVPLLASETATYVKGRGCQLEPWDD